MHTDKKTMVSEGIDDVTNNSQLIVNRLIHSLKSLTALIRMIVLHRTSSGDILTNQMKNEYFQENLEKLYHFQIIMQNLLLLNHSLLP